MNIVRAWPAAPILKHLPATARLTMTFDAERLSDELAQLEEARWEQVIVHADEGVVQESGEVGWQSLRLRTMTGGITGNAAMQEYANTPILKHLPYLTHVLDSIPAPIRGARLMAAHPGTIGPVHSDEKCGLPWGTVRLHVPITTAPGAVLNIDGVDYRWQPGEFWYADFSRPHAVRNTDTTTRVHLVIDSDVTRELLAVFPGEFHTEAVSQNTLFAGREASIDPAILRDCRCTFAMPSSFESFLETDERLFSSSAITQAKMDVVQNRLVLSSPGEAKVELVHIGHLEFRFGGWTTERTIQLETAAQSEQPEIILRMRSGDQVRALAVPARRLL